MTQCTQTGAFFMAITPVPVPTPTKKPTSGSGLVGLSGNPVSTSFLNSSYNLPVNLNSQGLIYGPTLPSQVLGASTQTAAQTQNVQSPTSSPVNTNPLTNQMNADIGAANTQYDRLLSDYNSQLSDLSRQKGQAVTDIQNAQQGVLSSVDQQKSDLENQKLSTIGEAASTARNTQKTSRNILRALGILNSSYAGDKLQEPMNSFDTARANIIQQAQSRVAQLDDFVNNKKAEFASQIAQINNTFASMQDKINNDIRFTDRSRLDAVSQLQAAYNAKIAELKNTATSAINQANSVKAFVANGLQTAMGQNPDLASNMTALNNLYSNLSSLGSSVYGGPQQTSLAVDQKKKNLDLNSAFSSGGLTLSGLGN